MAIGRSRTDRTGEKCGKWTVLSQSFDNHEKRKKLTCRCECGFEKQVASRNISQAKQPVCQECGMDVRKTKQVVAAAVAVIPNVAPTSFVKPLHRKRKPMTQYDIGLAQARIYAAYNRKDYMQY